MSHSYDLGKVVKVYTDKRFLNAESGRAIDPDVVNISIRTPGGDVTVYVYGTDAEVERDGVGRYHMEVDANEAGTWYYRIWSTGDGQAAEERSFTVTAAQAVE